LRKNLKQILLFAQIYFLDFHRLFLRGGNYPPRANFSKDFVILDVIAVEEDRGGRNETGSRNPEETP
jgi:hypothetical protein